MFCRRRPEAKGKTGEQILSVGTKVYEKLVSMKPVKAESKIALKSAVRAVLKIVLKTTARPEVTADKAGALRVAMTTVIIAALTEMRLLLPR